MPPLTSQDTIMRTWMPFAETVSRLDNHTRVNRAIGEDGYVRLDALPVYQPPFTEKWIDTGTVGVQINLPVVKLPVRCQLVAVHAHIFTAPTGTPMLLEIETNDNETLAELSIAVSENYGSVEGLEISLDAGTWIRQVTTQVGSGTAGSNLTVVAFFQPEAA